MIKLSKLSRGTLIRIDDIAENMNWQLMKKCELCHKPDKVHYRVKSKIYTSWIFCCKECWNIISNQSNYKYGGTRKSKL